MWPFKPRALDAISIECIISLRDEPERWAFGWRWMRGVLCSSFCREDGLILSRRFAWGIGWPIRWAAVEMGGEFVARGRDRKALWKAGEDWLDHQKATSPDVVRRFLSKAR